MLQGMDANAASSKSPLRRLSLYIEEPQLAVEPGTDWEEVRRTGYPPSRLAPDQDEVARKVIDKLHGVRPELAVGLSRGV